MKKPLLPCLALLISISPFQLFAQDEYPDGTLQDPTVHVTILSPATGDSVLTGEPIVLRFNEAATATRYRVQLYDQTQEAWTYSNNFLSTDVCSSDVCSVEVDAIAAQTGAKWRVRGYNSAGWGDWSERAVFNVGEAATVKATTLSPATGDSVVAGEPITLRFNEVATAAKYHVKLYDQTKNAWTYSNVSVGSDACNSGVCSVDVGSLAAQDLAQWRVRGYYSDGWGRWSIRAEFNVIDKDSTASTAVAEALASGDASNVTTQELVDALVADAQATRSAREQSIKALFGHAADGTTESDAITTMDWEPTWDSVTFSAISSGNVWPVLVSNASQRYDQAQELPLAMAGTADNGTRRLLLGGTLLDDLATGTSWEATGKAGAEAFARRGIAWLTGTATNTFDTAPLKIVVAHHADSYWFRNDKGTHDWLSAALPMATVNAEDACESSALAGCLNGADLLIISGSAGNVDDAGTEFDLDATLAALDAAESAGIPVLYQQYDGGQTVLGEALMARFGVDTADNYWPYEIIENLDPATLQASAAASADGLVALVQRIDNNGVDFSYSDSACPSSVGTTSCKPEEIANAYGGTLATDLTDPLTDLRQRLSALDRSGEDIFDKGTGYRALKLALLIADHYRRDINYPMDKYTTADPTFARAMFADHAVHTARASNTAQPRMGTFTDAQAELGAAPGVTRTLTLEPELDSGWRSTGLYIPPGRPVALARTDASPLRLQVKVNFLRHSTRIWNDDGYSRPRYLTSHEIELAAGADAVISTPYGGPLYVWVEGVEGAAVPLDLTVNGALDNPLLDDFAQVSIDDFGVEVAATDSDWLDIATPWAEIHSLKSHLENAFADQDGNRGNGYTTSDVTAWIDDLDRYLIAGNYAYAGFGGEGLPALVPAVRAWCDARGLGAVSYQEKTVDLCTDARIHRKPQRQHINSDVTAACGALCAGNPFDSAYPISPLGWGENHEMGHNLQRSRLKIYSGRSTEVSNNIFPMRVNWLLTVASGAAHDPQMRSSDRAGAFAILQSAIAAGTAAGPGHPLWAEAGIYDQAGTRLAFFEQLAWHYGDWDLYTRLYLLERVYSDALNDDARWAAARDVIGFGSYSRSDASTLSGNDFMYVTASLVDGRDFQDFFEAFGIELSDAAKAQVISNGAVTRVPASMFYREPGTGATFPSAVDLIALDGVSAWADPTP